MRKLILAAVLAALPVAAMAANVDTPEDRVLTKYELDMAFAAMHVCAQAGGNSDICAMYHAPTEQSALVYADVYLKVCDDPGYLPSIRAISLDQMNRVAKNCAETRAYIKQRWGY